MANYAFPIVEYSHNISGVCAVTGGYVYHGSALPQYTGAYFYADYCSGHLWVAKRVNGNWMTRLLSNTNYSITTFGETESGELCFTDYSSAGEVYCILP